MKFKIQIANTRRTTWWEEYDEESVITPHQIHDFASAILNHFNKYLRPGEPSRFYTRNFRLIPGVSRKKHEWEKVSLVTEKGGFDKMWCSKCGATGKRYGLSSYTAPDKKFDPNYC